MPLYEYECEACHKVFERIQKYSDPPVEICPQCGKGPVRKLLSSPAIQFKGSGWYITDYAKKSSGDAGKTTASGESSSKESKDKTAASTESTATKTETTKKE